MTTFQELYHQLIDATLAGRDIGNQAEAAYDAHQLDCLLNPEKHPPVWHIEPCNCPEEQKASCINICSFDAIKKDKTNGIAIDSEQCVGCEACVNYCPAKKLVSSRDIIPALKAVISHKQLTYALIAPAFLGQFSSTVTPGKLRTALKQIGFDGVIEVSLFADILTLKEALEFNKNIKDEHDYQLTSCCCPVWIALIKKIYSQLMPHVPGSVSPMIAAGRAIKILYPDALTVFIGPCMAKKAEAREPDLHGAIDYVLTFQEVQDIFTAMNIDPIKAVESERDHSSRSGRIYAYAGGVSEAVSSTAKRLDPHNPMPVKTAKADGVPACKALIDKLLQGQNEANFYEGMGCVGGCVGGPRALIDAQQGKTNVTAYGKAAVYPTPIDNPYVIELLERLGLPSVEALLEDNAIFTRHFK